MSVPNVTTFFRFILIAFAASAAATSNPAASQDQTPATVEQPVNTDAAPTDLPAEAPAPLTLEASKAAGKVIDWVIASHDNGDLPFVVIDKVNAKIFVFDPSARLLAQAPVLVGITKGDDSEPGVGDRELSNIPLWMRTTPAGRFVANFGPAAGHDEPVLWVDFTDAISLHAVLTSNPKERRVARLQSATSTDNRITFGCINVATRLYNETIDPLFKPAGGVVYILPETRHLDQVFAGIPPSDDDDLKPFDEVFAAYSQDDAGSGAPDTASN